MALTAILFVVSAGTASAGPLLVSIDPGARESAFSYADVDFFDLAGTPLDGRTEIVEVLFADAKFLVSDTISIELFLNQSGALGAWPAEGYGLSGYLLDETAAPAGVPTDFTKNVEMPAQIWPGWSFTLEGKPLLPTTIGFGSRPTGAIVDDIPGPDYSIDPVLFHGLHFEIQLPNSPGDVLLGSRLQFANFDNPIHVSPDSIPRYVVHVPDAGGAQLLLGLGVLAVGAFARFARCRVDGDEI